MTARTAAEPTPGSLPPLGGRLLPVYTLTWAILAAAAALLTGLSLLLPSAPAEILALRTVKAVALIAVSTILLRRRRRDPVAALLSLAFLLWTITSSFDFAGAASSLVVLLDRLRFLLFATALLLFPNADWRPGWTRTVAAASLAVFLIGAAEAVGWLPTRLFLPLAIGCVLAAIAALILRFRMAATQTERQQLKWVALGLVSGIGLILSARAAAAVMQVRDMALAAPIVLEGLFQLGIILVALGFLVSLLRYRLFDAEAAITRSAAYGGLTLALVATFAASEALIELFGQRYLGMGVGDVSAAIAAAIAAVALAPLHARISAWAEQRFERDLALLKRQLPELLAELSAGSSTRKLAAAALPRICEAIHAVRAAVMVDDSVAAACGVQPQRVRGWLARTAAPDGRVAKRDAGDLLFPIRLALRCPFGTVRGWLLLGPRPDGSLYGKHELAALEAVLPPLRQALFATKTRDDEKQRERRLLRAMSRKLEDLSQRVQALALAGSAPPARQAAE